VSPEFRHGERVFSLKLTCIECGKRAQGNVACAEGEICDACHEEAMADGTLYDPASVKAARVP